MPRGIQESGRSRERQDGLLTSDSKAVSRVGGGTPIRKVLRAPKRSNLAEYTEEHFCRDLARLVAAGRYVTPDGAKMELMPTAFPKDGMPLYLTDGVRFIGHVKFEEPPL